MRLRDWQEGLQRSMLAGDALGLALRESRLSAPQGIAIYANAYVARLCEALRSNYEALRRLLGDDDFASMARQFSEVHPPAAASIRWHGDRLPDFLASHEPYRSCPAIAELARFEWALRHTVDAADAERIEAGALKNLPPDQWLELRCDLHPSLSLLHFEWNAPQVWRALDADEDPPQPVRDCRRWLVYRDAELVANWRSADDLEVALLRLWADGADFGALCGELEQRLGTADAAAVAAAQWLNTWIGQGLLVYPHQ
jgi:hypothetical protein